MPGDTSYFEGIAGSHKWFSGKERNEEKCSCKQVQNYEYLASV